MRTAVQLFNIIPSANPWEAADKQRGSHLGAHESCSVMMEKNPARILKGRTTYIVKLTVCKFSSALCFQFTCPMLETGWRSFFKQINMNPRVNNITHQIRGLRQVSKQTESCTILMPRVWNRPLHLHSPSFVLKSFIIPDHGYTPLLSAWLCH